MNSSKNPILSISILASNRPDTIRKCLDSLRPIREAIPCELILVDTSGNRELHKILLEYTEFVYDFKWCNDFAKARNVGVSHAKGEWFMFLDDDEWFVNPEPVITFFSTGEYKHYGYANHLIRNFLDVHYSRYSDGVVSRLFKLSPETCFHSKVHEYFAPLLGPCKNLDAMSYHSGYVFVTEEKKRAHYERNSVLLLDMIEEEPANVRWYLQLLQEYVSVREWKLLQERAEYCLEHLADFGEEGTFYQDVFYAAEAESAYRLEEYDKCMKLCQGYIEKAVGGPLLLPVLHYRMADCLIKQEQWRETQGHLLLFLKGVDLCFETESLMLVDRNFPIICNDFDDSMIDRAYELLIESDLKLGKVDNLCKYYEKLGWNKPVVHEAGNLEESLLEAMATLPLHPIFEKVLTDVFSNKGLRDMFVPKMWSLTQKDIRGFEQLCRILSDLAADDAMVWYARLTLMGSSGPREGIAEASVRYFEKTDNVLALPGVLKELADAGRLPLAQYWSTVSPDRWKQSVLLFTKEETIEELRERAAQLRQIWADEDWHMAYYDMLLKKRVFEECRSNPENEAGGTFGDTSVDERLADWVESEFAFYGRYYKAEASYPSEDIERLYREKLEEESVVVRPFQQESYDDIILIFHKFMLAELEYGLCLYQDDAFEGELELLSPELRGAVSFNNMYGREAGDWRGMIADLRETVTAYPPLADNVRYFINKMSELLRG